MQVIRCKGRSYTNQKGKRIMRHNEGSTGVLERTENKSRSEESGAEQQEMMKKMEAAGTPGPAHKALEAFVGNWKAEVKCFHEGGAPQVSQGTAKSNWRLNGRFLEGEFHGEI